MQPWLHRPQPDDETYKQSQFGGLRSGRDQIQVGLTRQVHILVGEERRREEGRGEDRRGEGRSGQERSIACLVLGVGNLL